MSVENYAFDTMSVYERGLFRGLVGSLMQHDHVRVTARGPTVYFTLWNAGDESEIKDPPWKRVNLIEMKAALLDELLATPNPPRAIPILKKAERQIKEALDP